MLRAHVVLELAAHLKGAGITRAQRIAFPDGRAVHLWAFEVQGEEQVFVILEQDRAFVRWQVLKEGFWTAVLQYQERAALHHQAPYQGELKAAA